MSSCPSRGLLGKHEMEAHTQGVSPSCYACWGFSRVSFQLQPLTVLAKRLTYCNRTLPTTGFLRLRDAVLGK